MVYLGPILRLLEKLGISMPIDRSTLIRIRNTAFPEQLAFIKSKSLNRALWLARRGGKTSALAVLLLLSALLHPMVKLYYIGLTSGSAENAIWGECQRIFKAVGMRAGIEYDYNISKKTMTFDNGSTIRMLGADTSFKEAAKVLGGKYFGIVIDECQSYTIDLESIITRTIGPAVSDYINQGGGWICLAGTCGEYMGPHYWFRAVTDDTLGWEVHTWDAKANPHMAQQKAIEEAKFMKQYGPDYVKTDWYQEQYLNVWLKEKSDRIYNYKSDKCAITDSVLQHKLLNNLSGYKYILSTDLGHNDATAFVLLAWHKYDPNLYIVRSEKHYAISLEDLAKRLKWYQSQYPVVYWPIDSAGIGKLIVEDYRKQLKLPFCYPKSKTDKISYINMMNSAFMCSRIKVIEEQNKELIEEWASILCDKKALEEGYRKEADRYHNDLADSALYGFSIAKHYAWREEPKPTDIDERAEQQFMKLIKHQDRIDRLRIDDDPFKY